MDGLRCGWLEIIHLDFFFIYIRFISTYILIYIYMYIYIHTQQINE